MMYYHKLVLQFAATSSAREMAGNYFVDCSSTFSGML